jgi:hypothetical protein
VFLTSCRDCSSKLLQLDGMWLLPDGRHVARRCCPECGRADTVSANAIALWAWRRRSDRHRGELVRALLELIEDGEGSGSGAVSWDSAKARAELEAPCVRARGPSAGLHDEREWF